VSAHSIEVRGQTFAHKDTLKETFRLWWKGESWKGKYRAGSPLLTRLMSYCLKARLTLLVDGEPVQSVDSESEIDYASDYEADTVSHRSSGSGGSALKSHRLPQELIPHGFQEIAVRPSEEPSDWEHYAAILENGGPYADARDEQRHLLPLISEKLKQGYRNVIVECPTGTGKSALSYWLPLVFDTKAYLSTPLKGLQSQYVKDHPFMASAMGRGNYECALDDDTLAEFDLEGCNAANAPCRVVDGFDCEHKFTSDELEDILMGRTDFETPCSYYTAYHEAIKNRWFIGNTTYLTAMRMFGNPPLPPRPLLVVDEAHTVASTIEDFCGFHFSRKRITRLLYGKNFTQKENEASIRDYPFPHIRSMKPNTSDSDRKADCIKILLFLRSVAKEVDRKVLYREYAADEMADAKAFLQHTMTMMSELQTNWKEWVYQFDDDDVRMVLKVEPLSVARYAEGCFLSLGRQRVFMSGTIIDSEVFMAELGLKAEETVFLRVAESTFPKSKRPLAIKRNGGLMIWNKEAQGIQFSDLKKTADAIAEIAQHYPDHKGLILPYTDSIETSMADLLADNHPEIAARLIQHSKNPAEREGVLKDFQGSEGNGILMSTYANQGYDNRDIRFVIICKLPFLSLGDTKVQLKLKASETWYQTQTVRVLLQQYGRAMRAKDDWGHVYVVDAHFNHWFRTRNIDRLMPEYVLEAMV